MIRHPLQRLADIGPFADPHPPTKSLLSHAKIPNPPKVSGLPHFQAFRSITRDQLHDSVKSHLAADMVRVPRTGDKLEARADRVAMKATELWFCSYGQSATVNFPDSEFVRVQIPLRGNAITTSGDRQLIVHGNQSCISAGAVRIDFGEDYEQWVWRMPQQLVVEKLGALTGQPIVKQVVFDPAYDLSTPAAQVFSDLLQCALRCLETVPIKQAAMVLGELEQAMAVSLLNSSQHNYRELLDGEVCRAAPWQVQRAEAYLAANWDKPFDIEALAEATGASARSIFRTFKHHRGTSPLAFLKQIRLDHARHAITAGAPGTTITEVSLNCGWGDISRFSKDFAMAFGELPSVMLARSKGRAAR